MTLTTQEAEIIKTVRGFDKQEFELLKVGVDIIIEGAWSDENFAVFKHWFKNVPNLRSIPFEAEKRIYDALLRGQQEMTIAEKVNDIWMDYYYDLTGKVDPPGCDESGCLFHWIAEHDRNHQAIILERCYIEGLAEGRREQVSVIKDQIVALEKVRAVLREATRYTEWRIEAKSGLAEQFIQTTLPHINLLLFVVDDLLLNSIPPLKESVVVAFDDSGLPF